MSATDPLREALSAALSLHEAQPPNAPWRAVGAEDRWRANLLDALEAAARNALSAVPSEPNSTCVHDAEPKSSGEKLGAPAESERASLSEALLDESPNYGSEHCVCGNVATPARDCPVHWALWVAERHRPVEPEAWEWRVEHNVGIGGHLGPTTEAAWCRLRVGELTKQGYEAQLERRRAPGPWERVDPEPRHEPQAAGHAMCECGDTGEAGYWSRAGYLACNLCDGRLPDPEPRLQDGGEQ